MIKRLKLWFKRFGLFEISLISIGLIAIVVLVILLFRTTTYLTVTIKITSPNFLDSDTNAPYWYASNLHKGETEIDSLGVKQAEILDVKILPTAGTKKIVFLRISVRAVYSRATKQYSYQGKPLLIGSNLRLELQNQLIDGVITEMANVPSPYETKEVLLKAKLQDFNPVYLETEGVSQFLADAVNVGDSVKDSGGNTVLTIVDKTVAPADRYIMDNGTLSIVADPKKKDVSLTIKMTVQKINGALYYLYTWPVKVASTIPVDLPNVTFIPVITQILSVKSK